MYPIDSLTCGSWLLPHYGSSSTDQPQLRTEKLKIFIIYIQKTLAEVEMTQRLSAQPALPEVLSLTPSNHLVAHNHL